MNVLVIDDEPDICEIVSITFNLRWPEAKVTCAGSAKRGLDLARDTSPDVIILDLILPDADGLDLCAQLRALTDAPIVILTVKANEADKVKGLEAGADDYVTKPFNYLEFLARVRAVVRRHAAQSVRRPEPPYEKGPLFIDFTTREVSVHGRPVELPPVEYSLLYHLVKNANRVLPYKTLLAKVWGREYAAQTDYLTLHVERLRSRIGDDPDNPKLVLDEPGVGYVFADA